MTDAIPKAADCRVVACINDHVHVEFLDASGKVIAELEMTVDEACKFSVQIEAAMEEIALAEVSKH